MNQFIEDVTGLSDQELLNYSVELVQHEADIGLRIIACLREAEKRMLYCQLGFSSLWEFATQYLNLSNGNAHIKISAMRLARNHPIAQAKIETGELSLVNAAKVGSFLRQEEKSGKVYTQEQKTEVIESVLGLSQAKCELALLVRSPEALPSEKVRPLTETKTELKIVVDQKTMAALDRLRELLSNSMPQATYSQILDYLACEKVEVLERKLMGATTAELDQSSSFRGELTPEEPTEGSASPVEGNSPTVNLPAEPSGVILDAAPTAEASATTEITSTVGVKTENSGIADLPTPRLSISVKDRRGLMNRAKSRCEFVSQDGRRCSSRTFLEVDHIVSLFHGGSNDRSNYRIACKLHNLYYAQLNMREVMKKYVPSLN